MSEFSESGEARQENFLHRGRRGPQASPKSGPSRPPREALAPYETTQSYASASLRAPPPSRDLYTTPERDLEALLDLAERMARGGRHDAARDVLAVFGLLGPPRPLEERCACLRRALR